MNMYLIIFSTLKIMFINNLCPESKKVFGVFFNLTHTHEMIKIICKNSPSYDIQVSHSNNVIQYAKYLYIK